MKIIGTFGLAIAASLTVMQSAEARGAHYSAGFSGGAHFSAPARSYGGARSYAPRSYAGPSRIYSNGPGRIYSASRISSMPYRPTSYASRPRFSPTTAAVRNPTYVSGAGRFSGNRTAAFNSRVSRSNAQLTPGTRTAASRSQGFNGGRVLARQNASTWHRNWDHGRDHFWHGHRCHFHNGFWFIYDPWPFYPYDYWYGYGYYPYDGYYDSSYYDDGSHPMQEYEAGPQATQSEYTGDARVSDVQSALAREGYYDGAVDGVLGPATRRALRNYQRDHGLDATGAINQGVIEALRLR